MSKARDLADLISTGGTLADLTSSAAELNILDGVPATLTNNELGFVDGVTSGIQSQIDTKASVANLNTKAPLADPTFTGTVNGAELVLTGNLTVSGTTTTVNSNTVEIGDSIITLNSDEDGTPTQNGGIEIERGTTDNVRFIWDETNDQWSAESFNGSAWVAANFKAATATVTDLDTTSDQNLKQDIYNIENPVEKVKQISGVHFTWIETGKDSAGVIAQEVEAVMPELVTDKDEGYKAVNYMGIIGLLVETVKELENRIQQLEDS